MANLYEINLPRDIFREKSSEILADCRRYFKENGKNNNKRKTIKEEIAMIEKEKANSINERF